MKALYISLLILICQTALSSQRQVELSQAISNHSDLTIDCEWADVTLQRSPDNTVRVTGTVSINTDQNNDAYDIQLTTEHNTIKLKGHIPHIDKLPQYVRYTHQGKTYSHKLDKDNIRWDEIRERYDIPKGTSVNAGVQVDVKLTVYLPLGITVKSYLEFGDLYIEGISNDLLAKNEHGDIEGLFASKDLPSRSQLASEHGVVDISLPEDAKADLDLSTQFGELYSDLDMDIDQNQSTEEMHDHRVIARVNGGGAMLRLSSEHGNVYLRKQ